MGELSSSCQKSVPVEQLLLGADLQSHGAIAVDTTGAHLALADVMPRPEEVSVSVSEGAYRHLRQRDGWAEVSGANGAVLQNSEHGIVASIGWQHAKHADLDERGWSTPRGLRVAGLPDIYTAQQYRDGDDDRQNAEAIRARLQNVEREPLPVHLLGYEMDQARSTLPEALRDAPESQVAIHLAANALLSVGVQYGDARVGRFNRIIGDFERPEYRTVAAYHNGFGTVDDLRLLQDHLTNIGAGDEERLIAMVADAYSDSVYGNGRRSDRPDAYDELRSANLAVAHAKALGMDPVHIERLRQAILGTTFSEQMGTQTGQNHADPIARAVAGIDLQLLSEPDSLVMAFDLACEDGMSARFSPARTLGKVAVEYDARFVSTDEVLEFIDAHPMARPSDAPEGPTLLEAYATRIGGNAGFHDPNKGYQAPLGWTLERPAIRSLHRDKLRALAAQLLAGDITTAEGYRLAHEHAQEVRNYLDVNN